MNAFFVSRRLRPFVAAFALGLLGGAIFGAVWTRIARADDWGYADYVPVGPESLPVSVLFNRPWLIEKDQSSFLSRDERVSCAISLEGAQVLPALIPAGAVLKGELVDDTDRKYPGFEPGVVALKVYDAAGNLLKLRCQPEAKYYKDSSGKQIGQYPPHILTLGDFRSSMDWAFSFIGPAAAPSQPIHFAKPRIDDGSWVGQLPIGASLVFVDDGVAAAWDPHRSFSVQATAFSCSLNQGYIDSIGHVKGEIYTLVARRWVERYRVFQEINLSFRSDRNPGKLEIQCLDVPGLNGNTGAEKMFVSDLRAFFDYKAWVKAP
jgi:hypothetical protein